MRKLRFERHQHLAGRYRIAREFLADLRTDDAMHPLQLSLGYHAIGGPPAREGAEVRHVLELAQRHANAVAMHAKAALGHVEFVQSMSRLERKGVLASDAMRGFVESACLAWYAVGTLGSCVAWHWGATQVRSLVSIDFVVFASVVFVYGVASGVLLLWYAMALDRAAHLVRLSQGRHARAWYSHWLWQLIDQWRLDTLRALR
jgi:hypothetical protein